MRGAPVRGCRPGAAGCGSRSRRRAPRRPGRRRGPPAAAPARRRPSTRVVAPLEAEVAGEAAAAGVEHLGLDPQRGHTVWSASTPSSACWWQCTWTSARCPGATTAAASASACSASTSAKVRTPSASRAASGSSGSSSGPSARSAAVHDGSSPTTGHAGGEPRLDRAQAAAQHPAGGVDLAGGGPGQPAADGARRQLDGVAEGLEHGDGVGGDGGVEVVGEGVGPEQRGAAAAAGRRVG